MSPWAARRGWALKFVFMAKVPVARGDGIRSQLEVTDEVACRPGPGRPFNLNSLGCVDSKQKERHASSGVRAVEA